MGAQQRADLHVLLQLTRTISQTHHLDAIFNSAFDAFAAGLEIRRSAVLLFDAARTMRFVAWRDLSDAYRAGIEGHTPWTPDTSHAEPIVVPNVGAEPTLAAHASIIRAEGIEGLAFIPLLSDGRLIGKFMLYFSEERNLTQDELVFAAIIAAHVAFAIERTRALEAVTRSEERLRFALEAASMGTWDFDLRSQTVRWSDNLERVHGLPPGTFDGSFGSYEREIHPADRDRVLASLQQAITKGTLHDVEYRIVGPDGSIRWVEGKGRVDQTIDGAPAHMSGVCMDITSRKHAELARAESVEDTHLLARRLAAIVTSSEDVIIGKDLQGIISSWNPAAERLFGYSSAEVIGKPITIIIPKDRLHEETTVLTRIAAGQTIEHFETVRMHRDGTLFDVSLTVSPIRNEAGRVVGASKILRDVTQRKRNEAEMVRLQRRLMTLATAAAALLNSRDPESVRTATIATARDLLPADAYGLWRIDNPEDPVWRIVKSEGLSEAFTVGVISSYQGAAAPVRVAFDEPVPIDDVATSPMLGERLGLHVEEGIRSMLICPMHFEREATGSLVFYYRGPHAFSEVEVQTAQALANIAAAAATTVELADEQRRQRQTAEAMTRRAAFLAEVGAALAQSLEYQKTLSALAELSVPRFADLCVVDMLDEHGEVRRLAYAHVDPARIEQLRTLQERYPADPATRGGVHDVILTRKPFRMESISPEFLDTVAKDEEHRAILHELNLSSYICVPLLSARQTFGAITFVFAESGRRYTAEDLRFAQDLAWRASLAIENADAYQRAHEANRLKDDFLATLSHELRTPLNAIMGYAHMLGTRVLDGEKQTRAIAVLKRNAQSLKQIIDDVLDVARITSGKLHLDMQALDLSEVLTNAVATMAPAADAKRVRIETAFEPDVLPVLGDANRLQQVAWNLLSNAVKFTPAGGQVQVRLAPAGPMSEIVVSDNGHGIDPAFLPYLFERFRQGDSRFSREHGGLGLGLSIVHELVEIHGGRVSASSDGLGRGATFRVLLPGRTFDSAVASPVGMPVARPATRKSR